MSDKTTAKSFQNGLLLSLGKLSEFVPERPVPMKEVIDAVLVSAHMDPHSLGEKHGKLETHRLIQLAFRGQKGLTTPLTTSPQKGAWALTERGVERARQMAEAQGEALPTPAAPGVKLVEAEREAPDAGHVYDADPYIRSLAIAQSPCFGILYDEKHPTCDTCIIAKHCSKNLWERCQVAAAGETHVPASIPAAVAPAGTAEPLSFDDETSPVVSEPIAEGLVEVLILTEDQIARASRIKAAANLSCQKCEKPIKPDTWCNFIAPLGSFHPDCFKALAGKK